MHSDSDLCSWGRTKDQQSRCYSARASQTGPENSAWSVTGFYRAARPFAASGNDARRGIVDSGKTVEAAARPTNDPRTASSIDRRPQFLASAKRVSANFSAALHKHGCSWRGERRAAANSGTFGETFDAGKRSARSRAASTDLPGISRARWRHSNYSLHHVHGAAIDRLYVRNRRYAAITHSHPGASSSCNYRLLVDRRAPHCWRDYWLPRLCPQR